MTKDELLTQLEARFAGVSGMTIEYLTTALNEAMRLEGFASSVTVSDADATRILLRARIIVTEDLAFNTAAYFSFKDGEESIDKSRISANYLQLLSQLKAEYDAQYTQNSGFKIMKRLDRL
ncbi:hypothetical protein [Paenilisteria rocourtiae]|uniref:Uncharacterized protein n=1 Tax=Listeria rocourtiae TaxID=647910 RepID=A0A4R6ZR50_9LIST|nr:hypothetical protein [Listeria rocourtiae]EUJ44403.1 hypothetical protein PROCOU_13908 [Listeria rocourtiae FSL F6-920]TDR55117.1 hypothetical protein DFP96_10145 [Listeria rocourtiae]